MFFLSLTYPPALLPAKNLEQNIFYFSGVKQGFPVCRKMVHRWRGFYSGPFKPIIYMFPVQVFPVFSPLRILLDRSTKLPLLCFCFFINRLLPTKAEVQSLLSMKISVLASSCSKRASPGPQSYSSKQGKSKTISRGSNNFTFYPQLFLWQQIFTVKSAVPGEQKVIHPLQILGATSGHWTHFHS